MTVSQPRFTAVHVPRSLLGVSSDAPSFDVQLDGPYIARIAESAQPATGLLMSCPVDIHTHLDKNHVVHRTGAAQGDLHKAIALMTAERDSFTPQDLRERMGQGLREAYAAGTRAMRTHLDWVRNIAPPSLAVFESLRDEWSGRICLQGVSLTPLDFFDDAFDSEDLALEVATSNNTCNTTLGHCTVLGAFVWKNERIYDKLQRAFDLAKKNGLNLDFHVDEGLDPEARGLRAIAELTIKNDMQGRVACGHNCSLSVQPLVDAQATLRLCAQAGIALVALPTTNAYLQGSWTETPLERGIFRVNEASVIANITCIATDNVADGFFPYGSYDLLDTFAFGVQLAHLHPADEWLSSITTQPARAMNLPWDGVLREGAPADLVLLQARNGFELVRPAGRVRRVFRNGLELA